MNHFRILVIDDQAVPEKEGRFNDYERLKSGPIASKVVTLEYATAPAHATSLLDAHQYDFVILDVILDVWGDTANANSVFFDTFKRLCLAEIPMGFISGSWDSTSIPLVRRAMATDRPRCVPLFIATKDLETESVAGLRYQIEAHLLGWYPASVRHFNTNDEVCLLHLTDLHFGSAATDLTLAGEVNVSLLADAIKRECGQPPDLILITGDVTHTGHPREYALAATWIKQLIECFGDSMPSERIFIVPGNHDFSVPLATAQSITVAMEAGTKTRAFSTTPDLALNTAAQMPYLNFWEQICAIKSTSYSRTNCTWLNQTYGQDGFLFSGINTSASVGVDGWPIREILDQDMHFITTGSRKFVAARLKDASPPLHIQLSHHSPIRYSVREPIHNDERFEELFLNQANGVRPDIIFHGHEHARRAVIADDARILIFAGPTPSQPEKSRPRDVARGFAVVKIRRQEGVVGSVELVDYSYRAKDAHGSSGWRCEKPIKFNFLNHQWTRLTPPS